MVGGGVPRLSQKIWLRGREWVWLLEPLSLEGGFAVLHLLQTLGLERAGLAPELPS